MTWSPELLEQSKHMSLRGVSGAVQYDVKCAVNLFLYVSVLVFSVSVVFLKQGVFVA